MKTTMIKMIALGLGLLGIILFSNRPALAASPAPVDNQQPLVLAAPAAQGGTTIELCATEGAVTMPDGVSIPIWGFSDYAEASGTGPGGCEPAQIPGPVLQVNPGENVTIILHNLLPNSTSILFPGLTNVSASGGSPGFFITEAPASGTVTYNFTAPSAGTYLYESGTDVDKQVAMGLYGALIVGDAGGADIEEVLVLSEIDPALNADPAGFNMQNYHPTYWLLNGQAYPNTPDIEATVGDIIRLRYLNAGAVHHTMSLLGLYQNVIARDGFDITDYNAYAETIASGQTLDTEVNTADAVEGSKLPLYNRQFHITNGGLGQDHFTPGGGMMTFITLGANEPPVVQDDSYTIPDDETLYAIAGGTPPGILDNDSDPNNDSLTAILMDGPIGDLTLNPDGSFTYIPTIKANTHSLQLAGTGDYVSVNDAGILNPSSVTVEAWARFDSLGDRPHLVGKGTGSQGAYWLVVETDGRPAFFYTKTGGNWSVVRGPAGAIVLNTWYHFAGVYDETAGASIYVDGVLAGSQADTGSLETTDANDLWLGQNSGGSDTFAGLLDEVRIWSVARTPTQIQATMFSALNPNSEPDLVGYWPLDSSADDATGNANHGSLVNGAGGPPTWNNTIPTGFTNTDIFTYKANDGALDSNNVGTVTITLEPGTPPNSPPVANDDDYSVAIDQTLAEAAPGILTNDTDADPLTAILVSGPAYGSLTAFNADGSFTYVPPPAWSNPGTLQLAGTGDYVSVADTGILNPSSVTVEAWARFDSLSDRPHLVGKGTGSKGAYWLVVETDGRPAFFYTKTGGNWSVVRGPAGTIAPNTWYHFAGVFDETTGASIYVDGLLAGSQADTGSLETTDANDLWLGQNSAGSDTFAGLLDEVRIWDVARTQGEIQATMFSALVGNEPGLVGYWPLDSSATDATTNGSDGSLVNGASGPPTWNTTDLPPAAPDTDFFTYKANDGTADSNEALVTINLLPAVGPLPPSYAVAVTSDMNAQSDVPGATAIYTLQVTNNGNTDDTFDVVVTHDAIDDDWPTLAPITVGPLAAGASIDIQVSVDIPAGALDGDSDTATVTLTSQGDNGQFASSDLTTTAGPPPPSYAVAVTPATDAKSGGAGATVVYTLHVANTGNTDDTFDVVVTGDGVDDWTTTSDPVGLLAAGTGVDIQVSVEIPAGAPDGAGDTATVTVTGTNGQSASSDLTTTVGNVYDVAVTPATDAQSGVPGTSVVYMLQVTNNGNTADTFTVAIDGNPTWTTTSNLTQIADLAAGSSADIEVSVFIPNDAAGGAGDSATVTVTGTNGQSAQANLTTTADNTYSVEVAPATDAKSTAPGATVVYELQVTNTGNTMDTFNVDVVTVNGWPTSSVPTSIVDLAAGDTAIVNVSVDIPPDALAGDSDTATVTVTGTNLQSASSELTTTANTTHVGDLDGAATINDTTWTAQVTLLVDDANENPVADATVTVDVTWIIQGVDEPDNIGSETLNCTTGVDGSCIVERIFGLNEAEDTVTFTVTGVNHAILIVYESTLNHDPDGDSDGTTITVQKP